MFIRTVDEGLEGFLRARLPLPEDVGDVSFDTPTSNWSAQLSRITVNLFLYNVTRSDQPARSMIRRMAPDGSSQQRPPLPIVELSYLVSAWAGTPRDEHQLLGDVLDRILACSALPPEYLSTTPDASVQLFFGADPENRPRDVWSAAGAQLKAAFVLRATVAADAFAWGAEAPRVRTVESLLAPIPRGSR